MYAVKEVKQGLKYQPIQFEHTRLGETRDINIASLKINTTKDMKFVYKWIPSCAAAWPIDLQSPKYLANEIG